MNPGVSGGNGLLLHSFVDGNLVSYAHIVELVDGAEAVVGEHERLYTVGESRCSWSGPSLGVPWILPLSGC